MSINTQYKRKTILVFPFNLMAHYLRCIVLAKSYQDYHILFQSSLKYNKFVYSAGFGTFKSQHFDAKKVLDDTKNFKFDWLNEKKLNQILRTQVEAINRFNPEFVIDDTAPTLKMACEVTNTTYVSLINGYMSKYYLPTRKLSRSHKAYGVLKKMPESLADLLINFGEKLTFKRIHQSFARIREKHNLKVVDSYLDEIEGDYNLICDLPQLFPQRPLPSNYRYTGPLIYNSFQNDRGFFDKIDQCEKPIIFVSMGSTGEWSKLKFLNDSNFYKYSIITAGDSNKVISGPHVISKAFVNINQVLKRSSLMICHGGNGTIYHGIINHVYMLCISSHFEQEWNIHALEKHGYGNAANNYDLINWRTKIDEVIKKHEEEAILPGSKMKERRNMDALHNI